MISTFVYGCTDADEYKMWKERVTLQECRVMNPERTKFGTQTLCKSVLTTHVASGEKGVRFGRKLQTIMFVTNMLQTSVWRRDDITSTRI
jgi:hypothetical protein